jgi:hypothetical protein
MPTARPAIDKALEALVYAPVGLAVLLPSLVAEARTQVNERVQVARWVGEMAVEYGRSELAKRRSPS